MTHLSHLPFNTTALQFLQFLIALRFAADAGCACLQPQEAAGSSSRRGSPSKGFTYSRLPHSPLAHTSHSQPARRQHCGTCTCGTILDRKAPSSATLPLLPLPLPLAAVAQRPARRRASSSRAAIAVEVIVSAATLPVVSRGCASCGLPPRPAVCAPWAPMGFQGSGHKGVAGGQGGA